MEQLVAILKHSWAQIAEIAAFVDATAGMIRFKTPKIEIKSNMKK